MELLIRLKIKHYFAGTNFCKMLKGALVLTKG